MLRICNEVPAHGDYIGVRSIRTMWRPGLTRRPGDAHATNDGDAPTMQSRARQGGTGSADKSLVA